jgi:multidrug efflux pump subunit AcrB
LDDSGTPAEVPGRCDALNRLYLATARNNNITGNVGALVPLSAVTKISHRTQPLMVNHSGSAAAVTLSFNLPRGVALSEAVVEIDRLKTEVGIPASVQTAFQGNARAFPRLAEGHGIPADRRHSDRLHRARHSV